MKLIKARIKSFFHGLIKLYRIAIFYTGNNFVYTIQCHDCNKTFYQD